jgi:RimJ/RimL family protein N-acetyltransferase
MHNIIETTRLLLRPTQREDFDGYCELMTDEVAARFIGGLTPKSQVWRGMMTMAGSWHLTGVAMFSVLDKHSGEWLGRVGPWQPHLWPGTEVGWALKRSAWGKGYALEAACASMDYACSVLGWDQIIHTIVPENAPSIALAKRLGSRLIGPTKLPEPFQDLVIDAWGQSAEQWQENRKRIG